MVVRGVDRLPLTRSFLALGLGVGDPGESAMSAAVDDEATGVGGARGLGVTASLPLPLSRGSRTEGDAVGLA